MFSAPTILTNLGIENPIEIEAALDSIAPSMAEYYIQQSLDDEVPSPRKNFIQSVTRFGDYNIYVDYDNVITVETVENQDAEFTSALF
jgi:hypothetical protein